MESGAIADSQISASSTWRSNHAPQQARLHFKEGGGKVGGWSAKVSDLNQWLQVDLLSKTRVTRIATQGTEEGMDTASGLQNTSYSLVKMKIPSSLTDKTKIT